MSDKVISVGYVDACRVGFIGGWAWDPNQPDEPVAVDIIVDGQSLAQVIAREYRQDLKAAGIGNGWHGYSYALPSLVDPCTHEISVVIAGTTVPLPYSKPMVDFLGIYRFFQLQRKYEELYRGYIARGVKTTLNPNDNEAQPPPPLNGYLGVGVDALRVIINTLVGNLR